MPDGSHVAGQPLDPRDHWGISIWPLSNPQDLRQPRGPAIAETATHSIATSGPSGLIHDLTPTPADAFPIHDLTPTMGQDS